MMTDHSDHQIRLRAFEWLTEQVSMHGETLPWYILRQGFEFEHVRVPLMTQRGIFRPRILSEIPISITTSPKNPYGDSFGPDGGLQYRYLGQDPGHPDNVGLRKALATQTPLVYFHGLVKGKYLPTWPVLIVGDDPAALTFSVAVDDLAVWRDRLTRAKGAEVVREDETLRRTYITTAARRRLHQHTFRERVLDAYRSQCALCRLRHAELLDAAHIIPDHDPEGEPVVANGLSLCKLHHAAYDRLFLTVRPDYKVEVNHRILEEEDGPMLRFGLQELQGTRIWVPRSAKLKPDPDRLARRFEEFHRRATG